MENVVSNLFGRTQVQSTALCASFLNKLGCLFLDPYPNRIHSLVFVQSGRCEPA